MLCETLNRRAISRVGSPASRRLQRLFLLVRGELRRSPHVNAARLGALAAFAGAGADQLALELGKPAKHGEHKPPVRGRGVRPCVAKRAESGSGLRDRVERVQEVARRSREPVEARHKQGVALAKGFERARQFPPVGLRAARRLAENLRGSGGAQAASPARQRSGRPSRRGHIRKS